MKYVLCCALVDIEMFEVQTAIMTTSEDDNSQKVTVISHLLQDVVNEGFLDVV